jgi:hypothetical protein
MHPQAKDWQGFFASVYLTAFGLGSAMAAIRFFFGIEVPALQLIKAQSKMLKDSQSRRAQSDQHRIASKDATDFLIRQELLPVTNYQPDIERIKQNRVKVFIAVGEWSLGKNIWLAQVAKILAEKLGCELVPFPGHHGSFMDLAVEFAATLRDTLHTAASVDK